MIKITLLKWKLDNGKNPLQWQTGWGVEGVR